MVEESFAKTRVHCSRTMHTTTSTRHHHHPTLVLMVLHTVKPSVHFISFYHFWVVMGRFLVVMVVLKVVVLSRASDSAGGGLGYSDNACFFVRLKASTST